MGGPQPAPALVWRFVLVGGVVTVGCRQMCRGVVGGGEAQHPAAASHRYGGEYMAPFSDFDAALPYVAEMPKTLAELLK